MYINLQQGTKKNEPETEYLLPNAISTKEPLMNICTVFYSKKQKSLSNRTHNCCFQRGRLQKKRNTRSILLYVTRDKPSPRKNHVTIMRNFKAKKW